MSKIVLLSGWYYPYSAGGTEAYVHALARDLRTMGHDVRVAAPAVDESEQEYVHEGVEVYRYPISASPSLDEVQGTSPPEHLSTFRSWLESQAPDIVHTHSFSRGCGVFHLAAAKQLGIRTIVTVHTPDVVCGRGSLMRWGKIPCDGDYKPIRCTACCLQQRGLPQFAAWTVAAGSWRGVPKAMPNALRTALRYRHLLSAQHSRFQNALATADRVVAVSQWLYEMLTAAGVSAAKLRLNRQGLTDPTLFAQSASTRPRDRLRIAYVGRLHAVKGVDILIRGFREGSGNGPAFLP